MEKHRTVIFDMDGLLLDTERLALSAFNQTCSEFGIGEQTEVFMKLIGMNQSLGDEVLRNELNGLVDLDLFGRAWDGKYEELTTREPVPLKTGVSELLSYLKRKDVRMAVATSTKSNVAEEKLKDAGIFGYFRFIVGGDQVHKGKPDPEIFLTAASGLGVEPRACIAVEDSENGVRAAVAAGMTVFQVPDLVPPSQELLRLGHTVLPDLHHVLKRISANGWHCKSP